MAIDMKMQILVVDDYNTMLIILKNLLKQLGFHNVDQAMDGNEALQKLKASAFDFIISDWNMEPMTGIELLREVRADDKLKHIPFIIRCDKGIVDLLHSVCELLRLKRRSDFVDGILGLDSACEDK